MKKFVPLLTAILLLAGCQKTDTAEKAQSAFFNQYANALKKENQLEFVGPAVKSTGKIDQFGARIASHGTLRVSEARVLFVHAVEQFLAQANASSALKSHIDNPPLTAERLEFELTFWTADKERPQLPFVAQMQLKNGMIEYLYAKKGTQELIEEGPKERYAAAERSVMQDTPNKRPSQ